MSLEEFKKIIESIGFEYAHRIQEYKKYIIKLYNNCYYFYNGSEWFRIDLNDLTPFNKYFKRELRSIKLKKILG